MKIGSSWVIFKPSASAAASVCSTSSPTTPYPGVAPRVKAADDDDLVPHEAIEHAVGEPFREESPSVPVDDRCSQRVSGDHLKTRLDRCEDVFPKTGALILIHRYAPSTSAAAAGRRIGGFNPGLGSASEPHPRGPQGRRLPGCLGPDRRAGGRVLRAAPGLQGRPPGCGPGYPTAAQGDPDAPQD